MVPDSTERVAAALFELKSRQESVLPPPVPALKFSMALSREMGAGGRPLAKLVGERLGWPVYDHELLEEIAADLHVRVGLLEAVDEQHVNWLHERMEAFAAVPFISESTYVRQLIETVLTIGLRGHAVIVGRGAQHMLPHGSTLTVRVVAQLQDRIENVIREKNLSHDAAARLVRGTDAQRLRFIRDHFQSDPTDPVTYDLVLNTSRFSLDQCADLLVEALAKRQQRPAGATKP